MLVDATEEEAQPLPHGAEQQEDAGQGGGGAGDRYMAGGTAHAKELDWLRTQLETQDRVIDMLCKKIPCKDVIETLSSRSHVATTTSAPTTQSTLWDLHHTPPL